MLKAKFSVLMGVHCKLAGVHQDCSTKLAEPNEVRLMMQNFKMKSDYFVILSIFAFKSASHKHGMII